MTEVSKADTIDDQTQALVYGYIRNYSNLNNIPTILIQICLLYLWCIESFDRCTFDLEITDDCKKVQKRSSHNCWNNICYGKVSICSTSNKLVKWTFKINECLHKFYSIQIYLISHASLLVKPDRFAGHYKLNVNHAWTASKKYKLAKSTNIIKVILNTFAATLYVSIGEYTHCVYQNIYHEDYEFNWRIAVAIFNKNQQIELIKFECQETNSYSIK